MTKKNTTTVRNKATAERPNRTGRLIRDARMNARLSQRDLAKAINYSQHQFICHIELGTSPLPTKYIQPIAARIGIDPMLIVRAMIEDYAEELTTEVAPRGAPRQAVPPPQPPGHVLARSSAPQRRATIDSPLKLFRRAG